MNTAKCTKWPLNNFEAWKGARSQAQKEKYPEDIFMLTDFVLLCTWLSQYVAETRAIHTTPSTLYQLLTGLLWHIRDTVPGKKNIGTSVKHAEVSQRLRNKWEVLPYIILFPFQSISSSLLPWQHPFVGSCHGLGVSLPIYVASCRAGSPH